MHRSNVHERLGFKSAQPQFDQHHAMRSLQQAFIDNPQQQNQTNMFQNQLFSQSHQQQLFGQGNLGYQAREIPDNFRTNVMRSTVDVDRRMSLNVQQSATRAVPSVLDLNFVMPQNNVDRMSFFNRSSSANTFSNRLDGRSQPSQVQRSNVRPALKRRQSEEAQQRSQNSTSFKRNSLGQNLRKPLQGSSSAERSSQSDKSKFGCKLCREQFASLQEFDNHMASQEHSSKMSLLSTVCKDTNQHVRKNSNQVLHTKSRANVCTVCDQDYGNFSKESHLRSVHHKNRVKLIKNGCKWCHLDQFTNFAHYLNHLSTPGHKEKKKEQSTKTASSSAVATAASEKVEQSEDIDQSKVEETGVVEVQTEPTKPLCEAAQVEVVLTLDDLKFDPCTAVGVSEVIPVTGYFCKLCHKFYNNETMARVSHCKSQAHFDKYYEFMKKKLQSTSVAVKFEPNVTFNSEPSVTVDSGPNATVTPEPVASEIEMVTASEEQRNDSQSMINEHTAVYSELSGSETKARNTAVRGRGRMRARGRATVRGRR